MDKNKYIKDLQQRISLYEELNAYKQLFSFLFPSLYNFSLVIVKSKEIAEEIVSDVFIEIWLRRKSLLKIENLQFYMFISVRNRSVKTRKKEKIKSHLFIDETNVEFISDYGCPDEGLLEDDLKKKVKNAIKNLPPKCQLIYKLAKEDNMKYKEIAELLHISIKTVDNQMGIAIKRIATFIGRDVISRKK